MMLWKLKLDVAEVEQLAQVRVVEDDGRGDRSAHRQPVQVHRQCVGVVGRVVEDGDVGHPPPNVSVSTNASYVRP